VRQSEYRVSQQTFSRIKKTINARKLLLFMDSLREEISHLRAVFGVSASRDELIGLLEWAESIPKNLGILMPKYRICALIERFERILPSFPDLPEHATIEISLTSENTSIEVHLLEAKLYEDMAALLNLALEHEKQVASGDRSKATQKRTEALCRAAIAAAFYFVEAYLNGLAFDHCIQHQESLSASERRLMTEWDERTQSAKYAKFRDKLLHYPRILMHLQHPPLQENNCVEVRSFLDKARVYRDAVVHAAPKLVACSDDVNKERLIHEVTLTDAAEIVDMAVALVARVDSTIFGDSARLAWMKRRSPSGAFPLEAFD
jgi:hypothetical protein